MCPIHSSTVLLTSEVVLVQVEDAQVTMKLYQLHKREWEAVVRTRLTKREIRERKREKKRREGVKGGCLRWSSLNSEPAVDKPFNIMLHTDR